MEFPSKYTPKEDPEGPKPVPDDLTLCFPKENLEWLGQFLSQEEIGEHFRYSPSLKRHVFRDGSYWEARSVNPQEKRKALSHGPKPFILFGAGDPIVIVEDVVSAIKVGRVATTLPLFGSYLPPEWMVRLVKLRPKRIVVWLDSNKFADGMKYANAINKLAPIAFAIQSPKDPKYYNEEEIKGFLP